MTFFYVHLSIPAEVDGFVIPSPTWLPRFCPRHPSSLFILSLSLSLSLSSRLSLSLSRPRLLVPNPLHSQVRKVGARVSEFSAVTKIRRLLLPNRSSPSCSLRGQRRRLRRARRRLGRGALPGTRSWPRTPALAPPAGPSELPIPWRTSPPHRRPCRRTPAGQYRKLSRRGCHRRPDCRPARARTGRWRSRSGVACSRPPCTFRSRWPPLST